MKKLAVIPAVFIALVSVLITYIEWSRLINLETQVGKLQVQLTEMEAKPRQVEHKYRFERDGASLWRYDETTGKACQLESNVRDNWIGGHCPPEE